MNFFKSIFKSVIIVLLITSLLLVVLLERNKQIKKRVLAEAAILTVPSPTVITAEPIQKEKLESPDGTKTLTMEKQLIKNKVKYSFFIDKLFFEKEEVLQNMSIPYNAWSPDNRYIFLKESGAEANNYFVFNVSGDLFPNNVQYLDIQALFKEKVAGFTIEEVTGWAAPNLIIINTISSNGQKVSFWFDVPSQSFIQLSTYFN